VGLLEFFKLIQSCKPFKVFTETDCCDRGKSPRWSISMCLVSREGTNKMLQSLQAAEVPVLVFSAGLGDSVSAVLRYHNALLPNVHIISNYLRFNGLQVNGFQGDVIHSFNKNEHAIEKSDYFQVDTSNAAAHMFRHIVFHFLLSFWNGDVL
jgi:hypothetical protein